MDRWIAAEMVRLLPRLRRFAWGLTGSVSDGDDLVQSAYERAMQHIDKWEPGTRLDSWLFRIAQNLHRNTIRDSRNRRQIQDALMPTQPMVFDGAAAADDRQAFDQVWRQIMALPEEQREVLILICVDGLSYREAADVLQLSVGTVTSRLARARRTISVALNSGTAGPSEEEVSQ